MNQKTIITILGMVVVILLGTTIYFATVSNMSQNQPTTPVPIEQQPKTPVVTQPIPPSVAQPQNSKNDEKTYFEIKELGIGFQVDSDIASKLTYNVKDIFNGGKAAYFSSKELNDLSKYCFTDGVMAIGKHPGKPTDAVYDQYYAQRNTKQFNSFFISFEGGQAPCSSNVNLENQVRQKILAGFDSVTQISK